MTTMQEAIALNRARAAKRQQKSDMAAAIFAAFDVAVTRAKALPPGERALAEIAAYDAYCAARDKL